MKNQVSSIKRPPLPRRAFLGAALSAATVGGLSFLGLLGAQAAPSAMDFQFSRGTAFSIGQEDAVRLYLADIAPDARIHILFVGHTGTDGDTQANLDLSQARAEAAREIAQSMGISDERIQIAASGGLTPLKRASDVSDREFQRSLARVTISAQAIR